MTSPQPTPTSTSIEPVKAKSIGGFKKSKALKLKRRGAKVEEEEELSEGEAEKVNGATNGDDSDVTDSDESDFDPGADEDDEEEDEDTVEEDDGDKKHSENGAEKPKEENAAPAVIASTPAHPSWSDLPASTEAGSDLPTLDFASLSVSELTSASATPIPATNTPTSTSTLTKKQQFEAKKAARSAALKESDPAAWEKLETERAGKEKERREKRKEKLKAKKKEKLESKSLEKTDTPTSANSSTVVDKDSASKSTTKRPVVPSRPSRTAIAQGLVPSPSASTSTSDAPIPSTSNPPPRQRRSQQPSQPNVEKVREAYQQKLASDPSLTPRVGKFWSHDQRLDTGEARILNSASWRGGRGGGPGGERGRGRGRGRGGFGGESGRQPEEARPSQSKADVAEDAEDDGWGRGEDKKVQKPSLPPTVSSWNHDGFEEVKDLPPARSTQTPSTRGGRGKGAGTRGPPPVGPPGEINPDYAHLPFHPWHRFGEPTRSQSRNGDGNLFDGSKSENVVKIPGAKEEQIVVLQRKPEDAIVAPAEGEEGKVPVVVNLGPRRVSTSNAVPSSSTSPAPTLPPQQPQQQSVLYAAHPPPSADEVSLASVPVPASNFAAPLPPSYYQVPPHLAPVPAPQVAYMSRGGAGSPYYGVPAPGTQFYAPSSDPSYPGAHTPGTTPPPVFPHSQSPTPTSFFQPVGHRPSKIEIKAPAGSTHSHSPSLSKSILSARGESFNPRGANNGHGESPMQMTNAGQYDGYSYPAAYGDGVSTFTDANGVVYYSQPQPTYYNAYQPQQYPLQQSRQPYDPAILSAGQQFYRPQSTRAQQPPHQGYYDQQQQERHQPPYQSQWLPPPASYGEGY